ncbi:MAG: TSUP family transporter [Clostridia bacterium]|nr:TSUP family transporter [Clostridia bacterium]
MKKIIVPLLALAIGFITGFNGGGGGIFAVLLLLYVLKYPAKKAHATAIYIIFPLCAISAIIYLFTNRIDVAVALPATLGVAIGGVVGAYLLNNLNDEKIGYIFGVILLASACYVAFG